MATELHDHTHADNRHAVVPTAERLDADPELTGTGITIAFLDSGFYPHPDLTQPEDRIAAYVDVTSAEQKLNPQDEPQGWMWHGTMTSVVAAGSGWLCNGRYRGLAHNARVALVKVGDAGRITEPNIAAGLEWVLANRARYGIRIVSISLGGDQDEHYEQNRVDRLAEEAVRAGLVVVVAAGNSGCTASPNVVPPANAPSVITVGGYNDNNLVHPEHVGLYCSSFGWTLDGILKPEVLAPAIWVAAPILPLTPEYRKAQALSELAASPDYKLPMMAGRLAAEAELPAIARLQSADLIRRTVDDELRRCKVITTHYQHVDGTSFAAPIVASLAAQMLEANPELSPVTVKQILVDTARRIAGQPLLRQGYGVIDASEAVRRARTEVHPRDLHHFRPPRVENNKLVFQYHNDAAGTVSVAAAFNGWDAQRFQMSNDGGLWRAEIEAPSPGRYAYRFVIDGRTWIEDPSNGMKEPDGYGAFNSIVNIEAGPRPAPSAPSQW